MAGASGLLGRYVVPLLRAHGHEVVGLSRTGAGGHTATDYSVGSLVPLLEGADGVVDLAATRPLPGVTPDMVSTVVAGAHLVNAVGAAGVPALVQASSVSVYDPDAPRPLTEDSPTRPVSAYGLAKLTVERWAALEEHAGTRTVTLRISHLLAADDETGWLYSTYLRRGAAGEDLPVHAPLGPARDLLFAGDAARAVELALTTETARGVFNIAGPHLLTPAQVAQAVSEEVGGQVVGGEEAWRHAPPCPTAEELDATRAGRELDFVPQHDVRSALREIRAGGAAPVPEVGQPPVGTSEAGRPEVGRP